MVPRKKESGSLRLFGAKSNLANLGGLRPRLSLKQPIYNDDDEECRPWRRRFSMAFTWGSALRITLLLLLVAAVATACFTLPVEKVRFSHLGLFCFHFLIAQFVSFFLGCCFPFSFQYGFCELDDLLVPFFRFCDL